MSDLLPLISTFLLGLIAGGLRRPSKKQERAEFLREYVLAAPHELLPSIVVGEAELLWAEIEKAGDA